MKLEFRHIGANLILVLRDGQEAKSTDVEVVVKLLNGLSQVPWDELIKLLESI